MVCVDVLVGFCEEGLDCDTEGHCGDGAALDGAVFGDEVVFEAAEFLLG